MIDPPSVAQLAAHDLVLDIGVLAFGALFTSDTQPFIFDQMGSHFRRKLPTRWMVWKKFQRELDKLTFLLIWSIVAASVIYGGTRNQGLPIPFIWVLDRLLQIRKILGVAVVEITVPVN